MTNNQLQLILGHNVVELHFVRRHPKLGWANIRGMLTTTNPLLLNSNFGFQVIGFKPPNGVGMGYDYKKYNLCCGYDFFRQEYRVFGAEQVNIHKQWPLTNEEEIAAFQQHFYDYFINMSEDAKLTFMGFTNVVPQKSNPVVSKIQTISRRIKAAYELKKKKLIAWYNKKFFKK